MKRVKNFFVGWGVMQKVAVAILVLLAIVVCGFVFPWGGNANRADARDYVTISQAPVTLDDLLTFGPQGDFLTRLPATPELIAIAAKEKNVRFVSIENPEQYIQEGYVLINVLPFVTRDNLGMDEKRVCAYRIFYGTAQDMANDAYAVEVCATARELKKLGVDL